MKKSFFALLFTFTLLLYAEQDVLHQIPTAGTWVLSGKHATLSDKNGLELTLEPEAANQKIRILLKNPISSKGADTLQFFFNMPFILTKDYAHNIDVVMKDADGKEFLIPAGKTLNTHFAPGNRRKTAYWMTADITLPLGKSLQFVGLQIFYDHWNKSSTPVKSRIFFKDFLLSKINFTEAKLYYALANFKGNFNNQPFNGCEGRFLTDRTGKTDLPFLFLDNAVDFIKFNRPENLNLRFDLFDESDLRIWSAEYKNIPAKKPEDSFRKFEIPVTKKGTYRIRCKSYHAGTGAFFTEEWARIIILRGKGNIPAAKMLPERLAIAPENPWGVLKKGEKVSFQITLPDHCKNETWEFRYGTLPYTTTPDGFKSERKYTLLEKIPLSDTSCLILRDFPSSETLISIVAELYCNGIRVERSIRPIGISNVLTKAPPTDSRIPDLSDFLKQNKGIWQNLQIHCMNELNNPIDYFEKNIKEFIKITPLVGFSVHLENFEPLPGVFRWKELEHIFNTAEKNGAKVVLYLTQKYPPEWAPVHFFQEKDGRVHKTRIVWKYLTGGYNYATGKGAPELIRDFNIQLARRFKNHPGFGAYYFENEHLVSDGGSSALASSRDEGNKERYVDFLKNKYISLSALNQTYGTDFTSFRDAGLPDDSEKKTNLRMRADFSEYVAKSSCAFISSYQLDPVRKEDPRRPIIVYAPSMLRTVDAGFYESVVQKGAMLANGGVHSWLDMMIFREGYYAVPGLMERMEPHTMFSYSPEKYGLDDMIFGMLSMGGRGMNFHFFYRAKEWEKFDYAQYVNKKNPYENGYRLFLERFQAIEELATTKLLHDSVGILELPRSEFSPHSNSSIRSLMTAIHCLNHYKPKVRTIGGRMDYLAGVNIIFVCGTSINAAEAEYLQKFIQNGGFAVFDCNAASISQENPENPDDFFKKLKSQNKSKGQLLNLPGVQKSEIHSIGKGRVIFMRSPVNWKAPGLIGKLMQNAGINSRLFNSSDPYMQTNPLHSADAVYLAVTHRGKDGRSGINGPTSAENVKLHFYSLAPDSKYKVKDIWTPNSQEKILTGREIANGFNAGNFEETQMKIFKITLFHSF